MDPIGALRIAVDAVELTEPDVSLHADWLDALAEFAAAGQYHHGSGLTPDGERPRTGPAWYPADLIDPDRFAAFVRHLRGLTREDVVRPLGLVPDSKLWITVRDGDGERRYLGALSLRHELNDYLFHHGGHIGYGVRPSAAGRGVATQALRLALDRARGLALSRVLVTCEVSNPASARVITKCGGVFEHVSEGLQRYWITL